MPNRWHYALVNIADDIKSKTPTIGTASNTKTFTCLYQRFQHIPSSWLVCKLPIPIGIFIPCPFVLVNFFYPLAAVILTSNYLRQWRGFTTIWFPPDCHFFYLACLHYLCGIGFRITHLHFIHGCHKKWLKKQVTLCCYCKRWASSMSLLGIPLLFLCKIAKGGHETKMHCFVGPACPLW